MTNFSQIQPVRRRKLYEEVAESLEELIGSGDYKPGAELPPERELAEMFGVGRPAIREALFKLGKMGLVNVRMGKRAVVTKPTPELIIGELSGITRNFLTNAEGVRQLQAARNFFEGSLVRRAVKIITDDQLTKLEKSLAANFDAIGNSHLFEKTDVEFHYELVKVVDNPIFDAVHSGLVGWLSEQRNTSIRAQDAEKLAYESHKRIFEAVKDRDADRAEAEMTGHLDEVCKQYWSIIESTGIQQVRRDDR